MASNLNETDIVSECVSDCLSPSFNVSEELIQQLIPQVLEGNWGNLSHPLSEWQISELENLEEPGVRCLLNMWYLNQKDFSEEMYCNATWDNVYCWPPTPVGQAVTRDCSEVLKEMELPYAEEIEGKAFRNCLENGSWLWGNWTNYTQCADSYDQYVLHSEEERQLVVAVQHILFIGSFISLICLAVSVLIFFYFKCLWCDRVTVHIHLMVALILRSALLIVITEPFVFNRTNHYRNHDFICKTVLSVNLYATTASINWMFVQGVYLHGKLTTNVFDKGTPFKTYYIIGWGLPMVLIGVYATVMEIFHPVKCWKDYSERPELWILLGPMIVALLANFLFLIDIMRVLLTKVQRSSLYSDGAQFRRAIKATLILFPLLGVNNLIFIYNPGGDYNKYYVICNTLFGSTQGIFVAIFYCFVSRDVRDAIRRQYRRYLSRRSANAISRSQGNAHAVIQPRPRTHFRTKLATTPCHSRSDESCGPRINGNSGVDLTPVVNRLVGTPAVSPTSPFLSCRSCMNPGCQHNPVQLQVDANSVSRQSNR
ncbi:unnamed protein product [Orchesella dallaii]|uniref:Uncharacterized protein n=1 Tax=Orchesella dallaii TaxID=48710 RepID=A0ABP1S887_9HEXA